jgi:protein-disulfide isomerase
MDSRTFFPIALLLMVASFLVGVSWSKLPIFKGSNLVNPSPKQQAQASVAPQQPQVLGAQAIDNLVKGGVVLGAKDAAMTVVEFSDPSCPYCAAAAGADIVVGKDDNGNPVKIISDYLQKRDPSWEAPVPKLVELAQAGKIKLVFRYYPGHGSGENAMIAAWCAADQGETKFWDFLDKLFENQDKISDMTAVIDLATQVGLDKQKLSACIQSDKYKERLQTDIKAGQEAAKEATGKEDFGTPTFFVNGQMIVGAQSWQAFASIVEPGQTTK